MKATMSPWMPIVLLLTLAGCDSSEQFEKPGTWKLPPTGEGANDANLRTMLVNPHDLIVGANEPGSLAAEAVHPVDLLMTGQRKKSTSISTSGVGGSGGGDAGGGATGTGGQQ